MVFSKLYSNGTILVHLLGTILSRGLIHIWCTNKCNNHRGYIGLVMGFFFTNFFFLLFFTNTSWHT